MSVLASIEEGIQDVTIREGEIADFTCKYSKDVLQIDVDWMVGNVKYDECGSSEEDIGSDGNGCYTTDTQSILLLKNTKIFTAGSYLVQCTLKQSIPNNCKNHSSIQDDLKSIKTSAFLIIGNSTPWGGSM